MGPFTEIRSLDKDLGVEGRLRVWYVLVVSKFVSVIDEGAPCLLSSL